MKATVKEKVRERVKGGKRVKERGRGRERGGRREREAVRGTKREGSKRARGREEAAAAEGHRKGVRGRRKHETE